MSKRRSSKPVSRLQISALASLLLFALVFMPQSAMMQTPETRIRLDSPHDAIPGGLADVNILLEQVSPQPAFDDFDLLIVYDQTLFTLVSVSAGELLLNCDWEFFDYQSLGIAPGLVAVRIVGVADQPEIAGTPTCFINSAPGVLANIKFLTSADPANQCYSFPIRFYWSSCDDNRFSSATGDTVHIAYDVCPILFGGACTASGSESLPTFNGTPNPCTAGLIDGQTASRTLTFMNELIDIACSDSTDPKGDINLNGIGYEIADFILYGDYFLYGFTAWSPNPIYRQAQIASSDANRDGHQLSFQDYVYMYRVILGDAPPFPKPVQSQGPTAYFTHNVSAKSVRVGYLGDLAGALFVFNGEITPTFFVPTLDTSGSMVVHSGGKTRIVMPPVSNTSHPSGLWFTYTGIGDLDSVATADWLDQAVPTFIIVDNIVASCGDVNADGSENISDAVFLINYIFSGGPAPFGNGAGDVDCNGIVTVSDAVYLVVYIFAGGPAPCINCP